MNSSNDTRQTEPTQIKEKYSDNAIERTRSSWVSARKRCLLPTSTHYNLYGGRGVSFCERWLVFENFLEDMGPRPDGTTLDRIDVDGNYNPDNCRWATWTEQQNNKRNNIKVNLEGDEKPVRVWAQEIGINEGTIKSRIRANKTVEEILSPRVSSGGRSRKDYTDLIGKVFGLLTIKDIIVPEPTESNRCPSQRAICECVCGKIRDYNINNIVNSKSTTSCGCRGVGITKIEKIQKGDVFGEWTVLETPTEDRGKNGTGRDCPCRCSCGVIKNVNIYSLSHGQSTNCGHKFLKHGSASRGSEYYKEYKAWDSMKSACYNPKNKAYRNIGAKSIEVCSKWVDSFDKFISDMGKRPEGYILCRRDKSQDFSPDNCLWGTRKQSN